LRGHGASVSSSCRVKGEIRRGNATETMALWYTVEQLQPCMLPHGLRLEPGGRGPSLPLGSHMFTQTQTLTEIIDSVCRAADDACGCPTRGIPIGRTPGRSHGRPFFFAPAVPLIWINGRRSEEHTVRVTPRMGCPLCCFPFDLRPPLSQTALFFLTLCGSFDLDQRSDLPGVDRGDGLV